jgi:hypothetical protein
MAGDLDMKPSSQARPKAVAVYDAEATLHCPSELLAGLLASERARAQVHVRAQAQENVLTAAYEMTVVDLRMPEKISAAAFFDANSSRVTVAAQRPPVEPEAPLEPTVQLRRRAAPPTAAWREHGADAGRAMIVALMVCGALVGGVRLYERRDARATNAPLLSTPLLQPSTSTRPAPSETQPRAASGQAVLANAPQTHRAGTPSSASASTAQAVELLARNEYALALGAYRALAGAHPSERVYGFIAQVLQSRLARSCADRLARGGEPCALP